MKPVIVAPAGDGKYNVQVLKTIARPGVGEYTHFMGITAAEAKKILEDMATQKANTLTAVTQRITEELAEIQLNLETYFPA